jgi:hypothetical protein
MYERMLNKKTQPTFEEMLAHTGDSAKLWLELEKHITDKLGGERTIRFPYGNSYGWGGGYKRKSKHICDIFAEKDAISILMQIKTDFMEKILPNLEQETVGLWEDGSPCATGRWIDFRITTAKELEDAKRVVSAKMGVFD